MRQNEAEKGQNDQCTSAMSLLNLAQSKACSNSSFLFSTSSKRAAHSPFTPDTNPTEQKTTKDNFLFFPAVCNFGTTLQIFSTERTPSPLINWQFLHWSFVLGWRGPWAETSPNRTAIGQFVTKLWTTFLASTSRNFEQRP